MISTFCNDALGSLDGVGLAEKIAAREISALEAVEAAITRARSVNTTLNAIVTGIYDQAIARAGEKLSGPFAGVPTLVKDTDDVPGAPTLFGSRAVPVKIKKKPSPFVAQFLSLGIIVIGKTTLPELGLTATTEPVLTGQTRNPWNTDYSTGGSSGGSAALVAAGVVPFAHGNDGGGSIRIPAACCGLVGLKPTRDRLKRVSGTQFMPINIVHQGMLSRTVRDTAVFYAGAEKYYRNPELPEIGTVSGPGKRRLRIGVFTESLPGKPCHPENAGLTLNVARLCESMGHTVEEIPSPSTQTDSDDFIAYWAMMAWLMVVCGKVIIDTGFKRKNIDAWTSGLIKIFQKNVFSMPSAIRRLKRGSERLNGMYTTYDVLLSPTLAHPVPRLGHLGPDVPFNEAMQRVRDFVSFTPFQNISGSPAISLPMGTDTNGLPIGVQFAAGPGQERTLLELAFELEQARPWPRGCVKKHGE